MKHSGFVMIVMRPNRGEGYVFVVLFFSVRLHCIAHRLNYNVVFVYAAAFFDQKLRALRFPHMKYNKYDLWGCSRNMCLAVQTKVCVPLIFNHIP